MQFITEQFSEDHMILRLMIVKLRRIQFYAVSDNLV